MALPDGPRPRERNPQAVSAVPASVANAVQIGRATLYLGDCRDILPHLPKADAVVTDPPYGIDAGNMKLGNAAAGRIDFCDWDSEAPDLNFLVSLEIPSIIWGGQYFSSLPPKDAWLVWHKGEGMRGRSFAEAELAWTNLAIKTRQISLAPNNDPGLRQGRVHKCQKPVPLMKWCLSFLPDAQTILDPFMGSGTTGVAAIQAGKSFIGVEREGSYFEAACRRIREANGDDLGPLFGDAA